MIVYRIFCGSFGGSSNYYNYDEAQAAANFRTYCTGHEWVVREIKIP